jgi:hypothetical protein
MDLQASLLHTVASHLPGLKILRCFLHSTNEKAWITKLADFKPMPGLRYVKELDIDLSRFVLVRDGESPVGYEYAGFLFD